MNCFLLIFMITLTVATSNPVDGVSCEDNVKSLKEDNKVIQGKYIGLNKNFTALTGKYHKLQNDNNNFQQQLISNEDRITQLEHEKKLLSDDGYRIAHCGVINSMEDESITASSVWGNWHHDYGTQHSRLNTESGYGGWLPNRPHEGSWIELNLGKDEEVTAVATQGSWIYDAWTKTYSVSYKSSTSSVFSDVKNQSGEKQIFNGNTDWRNTVVINDFTPPLTAQFIRIHPLTWNKYPYLRFDLLSC